MKDWVSTMTQKGQVTIPAEIRTLLGLKPHDRVRFSFEEGEVKLEPLRSQLLAGFGAVVPRFAPEDWSAVQAEAERLLADEVVAEG